MNYIIDEDKIYLSIDKGEEVNASLLMVCEENDIFFGWINGIGAIDNPELGYYDIKSKDYIKKTFKGDFEIVSLIGNMTFKDGQRFIHTHLLFTDEKFNAYGGHLFECRISAAGEFIIFMGNNKIDRKYNNEVGLALWDCKIDK
tara:strand:+ start:998 stop:1429 length:432 start_codon:yes stop_codon:yes gene_type:complete